jgi:flavin-dependent dehydrogenase
MTTVQESNDASKPCDVTILGGGLAGLTLALQCRQEIPSASITILEKRRHPAPEAAHKVGESTVEIGTHYFTDVLGLHEHLENQQLGKLGLRFFFGAGDNWSIEQRLEIGGKDFPPKPSYQLDRGRFESFLAQRCLSRGVTFLDGATVQNIELGNGKKSHRVAYTRDNVTSTVESRWVADCSGRAELLKRKLGLQKEATHRANAVWFRIGAEIRMDDWSADPEWGQHYDSDVNPRWLSTNHLMGAGYWVWLIPLASGCTSIGIVADEDLHPLREFNSFEMALTWLDKHEPQCAEKIRDKQADLKDFLAIKRYARECKQVFSSQRWGITGEAGFFLDPFYSPGSDFIGFGNTFLCELIKRNLAGKSNYVHAKAFDFLYKQLHYGTAVVYQDQYALFGNHQVMPIKILWDFMIYWTLSSHIFCHGKTVDLSMYAKHLLKIKRLNSLNAFMQKYFRKWHKQGPSFEATGDIEGWELPVLLEANRALLDDLNDQAYAKRFAHNVAQMETLFWEIIDFANLPGSVPFKRKHHPDTMKGSFDTLFDATQQKFAVESLGESS